MAKVSWKTIKGYGPYAYLQMTVREGKHTYSKHLAYLGGYGVGGIVGGKTVVLPADIQETTGYGIVNVPELSDHLKHLLNQVAKSGVDGADTEGEKTGGTLVMTMLSGTSSEERAQAEKDLKAAVKAVVSAKTKTPAPAPQPKAKTDLAAVVPDTVDISGRTPGKVAGYGIDLVAVGNIGAAEEVLKQMQGPQYESAAESLKAVIDKHKGQEVPESPPPPADVVVAKTTPAAYNDVYNALVELAGQNTISGYMKLSGSEYDAFQKDAKDIYLEALQNGDTEAQALQTVKDYALNIRQNQLTPEDMKTTPQEDATPDIPLVVTSTQAEVVYATLAHNPAAATKLGEALAIAGNIEAAETIAQKLEADGHDPSRVMNAIWQAQTDADADVSADADTSTDDTPQVVTAGDGLMTPDEAVAAYAALTTGGLSGAVAGVTDLGEGLAGAGNIPAALAVQTMLEGDGLNAGAALVGLAIKKAQQAQLDDGAPLSEMTPEKAKSIFEDKVDDSTASAIVNFGKSLGAAGNDEAAIAMVELLGAHGYMNTADLLAAALETMDAPQGAASMSTAHLPPVLQFSPELLATMTPAAAAAATQYYHGGTATAPEITNFGRALVQAGNIPAAEELATKLSSIGLYAFATSLKSAIAAHDSDASVDTSMEDIPETDDSNLNGYLAGVDLATVDAGTIQDVMVEIHSLGEPLSMETVQGTAKALIDAGNYDAAVQFQGALSSNQYTFYASAVGDLAQKARHEARDAAKAKTLTGHGLKLILSYDVPEILDLAGGSGYFTNEAIDFGVALAEAGNLKAAAFVYTELNAKDSTKGAAGVVKDAIQKAEAIQKPVSELQEAKEQADVQESPAPVLKVLGDWKPEDVPELVQLGTHGNQNDKQYLPSETYTLAQQLLDAGNIPAAEALGKHLDDGGYSYAATDVKEIVAVAKEKAELDAKIPAAVTSPTATPLPEKPSQVAPTWTKLEDKKGSTPGGVYQDELGVKYYVKCPATRRHTRNELLAQTLYKLAGVNVLTAKGTELDGQHCVASEWKETLTGSGTNPKDLPGTKEGFVTDAWLANWDSVGVGVTKYDNILNDDGKAIRVDTGGTLLYRGTGGAKGDGFGSEVTELEGLRNSTLNPVAASVYGDMTLEEIRGSAKAVLAISDKDIAKAVSLHFKGDSGVVAKNLRETLVARKEYIKKWLDEQAEDTKKNEVPPVEPFSSSAISAALSYGASAAKAGDKEAALAWAAKVEEIGGNASSIHEMLDITDTGPAETTLSAKAFEYAMASVSANDTIDVLKHVKAVEESASKTFIYNALNVELQPAHVYSHALDLVDAGDYMNAAVLADKLQASTYPYIKDQGADVHSAIAEAAAEKLELRAQASTAAETTPPAGEPTVAETTASDEAFEYAMSAVNAKDTVAVLKHVKAVEGSGSKAFIYNALNASVDIGEVYNHALGLALDGDHDNAAILADKLQAVDNSLAKTYGADVHNAITEAKEAAPSEGTSSVGNPMDNPEGWNENTAYFHVKALIDKGELEEAKAFHEKMEQSVNDGDFGQPMQSAADEVWDAITDADPVTAAAAQDAALPMSAQLADAFMADPTTGAPGVELAEILLNEHADTEAALMVAGKLSNAGHTVSAISVKEMVDHYEAEGKPSTPTPAPPSTTDQPDPVKLAEQYDIFSVGDDIPTIRTSAVAFAQSLLDNHGSLDGAQIIADKLIAAGLPSGAGQIDAAMDTYQNELDAIEGGPPSATTQPAAPLPLIPFDDPFSFAVAFDISPHTPEQVQQFGIQVLNATGETAAAHVIADKLKAAGHTLQAAALHSYAYEASAAVAKPDDIDDLVEEFKNNPPVDTLGPVAAAQLAIKLVDTYDPDGILAPLIADDLIEKGHSALGESIKAHIAGDVQDSPDVADAPPGKSESVLLAEQYQLPLTSTGGLHVVAVQQYVATILNDEGDVNAAKVILQKLEDAGWLVDATGINGMIDTHVHGLPYNLYLSAPTAPEPQAGQATESQTAGVEQPDPVKLAQDFQPHNIPPAQVVDKSTDFAQGLLFNHQSPEAVEVLADNLLMAGYSAAGKHVQEMADKYKAAAGTQAMLDAEAYNPTLKGPAYAHVAQLIEDGEFDAAQIVVNKIGTHLPPFTHPQTLQTHLNQAKEEAATAAHVPEAPPAVAHVPEAPPPPKPQAVLDAEAYQVKTMKSTKAYAELFMAQGEFEAAQVIVDKMKAKGYKTADVTQGYLTYKLKIHLLGNLESAQGVPIPSTVVHGKYILTNWLKEEYGVAADPVAATNLAVDSLLYKLGNVGAAEVISDKLLEAGFSNKSAEVMDAVDKYVANQPKPTPDAIQADIPTSGQAATQAAVASGAAPAPQSGPPPSQVIKAQQEAKASAGQKNWAKDLENVGGQLGSNYGGQYKDKVLGSLHYVKWPGDDRAKIEALTSDLYMYAGVYVPTTRAVNFPDPQGGGSEVAVVSDWLVDPKSMSLQEMRQSPYIRNTFLVDAWLANWDVVGLSADNIISSGGAPIRIDAGGSLVYRAKGTPKKFGVSPDEFTTMRNSSTNPQAAQVFSNLKPTELAEGIKYLQAMTDVRIYEAVDKAGLAEHPPQNVVSANDIGEYAHYGNWLKVVLTERRDRLIQMAKAEMETGGVGNAATLIVKAKGSGTPATVAAEGAVDVVETLGEAPPSPQSLPTHEERPKVVQQASDLTEDSAGAVADYFNSGNYQASPHSSKRDVRRTIFMSEKLKAPIVADRGINAALHSWKGSAANEKGQHTRWAIAQAEGKGETEIDGIDDFMKWSHGAGYNQDKTQQLRDQVKTAPSKHLVEGLKVTNKINRGALSLIRPGQKTVRLYRGFPQDQVNYMGLQNAKVGQNILFDNLPAYSWSFSPKGFGVLKIYADVPVDKIMLTDRVDNATSGYASEDEVIFRADNLVGRVAGMGSWNL